MLHLHLCHREILGVASCKRDAQRDSDGRDQAIRLRKRDADGCVLAAPLTSPDALRMAYRRDPKPGEQPVDGGSFGRPDAAMNLFDVDRGGERRLAVLT